METFFRVRSCVTLPMITVQLRERRRIGSRLLAEASVWPHEYASGAEAVKHGQRLAERRWLERATAEKLVREAREYGKKVNDA